MGRMAFDTEPHLRDPSGAVVAWFTEPAGVVMQFARPAKGTVEIAEWLVGPGMERLMERFPGDQKIRFVMDLGLMQGRDPGARGILHEATKKMVRRIEHSTVVVPQNANPVYLAALHVSVSMLRVFGVPIEIQTLTNALLTLRALPPEPPRSMRLPPSTRR